MSRAPLFIKRFVSWYATPLGWLFAALGVVALLGWVLHSAITLLALLLAIFVVIPVRVQRNKIGVDNSHILHERTHDSIRRLDLKAGKIATEMPLKASRKELLALSASVSELSGRFEAINSELSAVSAEAAKVEQRSIEASRAELKHAVQDLRLVIENVETQLAETASSDLDLAENRVLETLSSQINDLEDRFLESYQDNLDKLNANVQSNVAKNITESETQVAKLIGEADERAKVELKNFRDTSGRVTRIMEETRTELATTVIRLLEVNDATKVDFRERLDELREELSQDLAELQQKEAAWLENLTALIAANASASGVDQQTQQNNIEQIEKTVETLAQELAAQRELLEIAKVHELAQQPKLIHFNKEGR